MGEELINGKFPLDAIFCPSDFISFGILDSFLAKGLNPGCDFKLIGYDNFEGGGMLPYGKPTLSSVDFPRDTIARRAVRMLLNPCRLDKDSTQIIRIPCELIERASTNGQRAEVSP